MNAAQFGNGAACGQCVKVISQLIEVWYHLQVFLLLRGECIPSNEWLITVRGGARDDSSDYIKSHFKSHLQTLHASGSKSSK
jgi:hypothetical protein